SDIQSHPTLADASIRGDFRLSIIIEFIRNHGIDGKHQVDRLLLCLLNELPRQLQLVFLYDRLAYITAYRFEKGIRHAPADNKVVDFIQELLDDEDLVRYFGTTHDRREGPFGVLEHTLCILQLGSHNIARAFLI